MGIKRVNHERERVAQMRDTDSVSEIGELHRDIGESNRVKMKDMANERLHEDFRDAYCTCWCQGVKMF